MTPSHQWKAAGLADRSLQCGLPSLRQTDWLPFAKHYPVGLESSDRQPVDDKPIRGIAFPMRPGAKISIEALVRRTRGYYEQGGIMYFKQFYLGCLAHASYLIGSDGAAAVVDPQRDVDHYIQEATSLGLTINYVIETHLHADFVSGHMELAARTGAQIVFGQRAAVEFPHRSVNDGDEIKLGKVVLRFLETPGHTPESISVLVTDSEVP